VYEVIRDHFKAKVEIEENKNFLKHKNDGAGNFNFLRLD